MFLVTTSVCAPLPSVSENDRNSARIAITSAILRLKPAPCSPSSAFSIASWISDMMFASPLVRIRRAREVASPMKSLASKGDGPGRASFEGRFAATSG